MSIEKIERELREALSGLTQLEMASRGMIPTSRAMVEAHEAYTKLCGDRENIRALLDELSRLREANRKLHRRVQQAEAANQSSEAILEGWCKFLRNRANRQFENTLFHIALGDIMNSRARIERRALSEREG